MQKDILGIHYGHDATAVLMRDGQIVEAMSEERLSRQKKHIGFPHLAVEYIKNKYDISDFSEVSIVGNVKQTSVFNTLENNIENRKIGRVVPNDYLRSLGHRFALVGTLFAWRDARISRQEASATTEQKVVAYIAEQFPGATITYIDHHMAHAWATVPFMDDLESEKLVLTLDGAGDRLSGSICRYKNGSMERLHEIPVYASLGLLYSAVTDYLGMTRNEHEFKVMGLAPYTKAKYGDVVFKKLKEVLWFDAEAMTMKAKFKMGKATSYLIAHSFYQYRFDAIAYGVQKLAEECIKDMASAAIKKYQISDIAIGGGVFMNVKANQVLRELPELTSLTVTPSGGDESLAVGAVVARFLSLNNNDVNALKPLSDIYLGSESTEAEITAAIKAYAFTESCAVQYFDPAGEETIEQAVAKLLADNSVVGRFKGRSEWGARALGNRSILANPSSRENVQLINEMIKGRDFWMPFATSILAEYQAEYLVNDESYQAPYMAITFNTKPRAAKELLAALHPYDLTSRPQMVTPEANSEYHQLISHFHTLTGIGGVLNTSFNLHGEPNVEYPIDALRTFEHSGLPHLALGNYLISKPS